MFECARELNAKLTQPDEVDAALRSFVTAIKVQPDQLEVTLDSAALGRSSERGWTLSFPLPTRKPFREAKIRMDGKELGCNLDQQLIRLIAEAFQVQDLVIASPQLIRCVHRLHAELERLRRSPSRSAVQKGLAKSSVKAFGKWSPLRLHRVSKRHHDLICCHYAAAKAT